MSGVAVSSEPEIRQAATGHVRGTSFASSRARTRRLADGSRGGASFPRTARLGSRASDTTVVAAQGNEHGPVADGAEDLDGGLCAVAADPDAGSGNQGTEVFAAAEGAGPVGAPGLADAAVPALDRGDPFLKFFLDVRGVDAEVVEDTAGGGAGVQGQAEQQVLGPELGLTAPGGPPSRPCDSLFGFSVPNDAAFPPVVGDHRGLEEPGVGLADLVAGDAEPVEDVRSGPDVQEPE